MFPIPSFPFAHDMIRSLGVTMNSFIDLESDHGCNPGAYQREKGCYILSHGGFYCPDGSDTKLPFCT